MRNIIALSFLALLLAGCDKVDCYKETGTAGVVDCEKQPVQCDANNGWKPYPIPSGTSCRK